MAFHSYYREEINFTEDCTEGLLLEKQEKIVRTLAKNQAVGIISGYYSEGYPVYLVSDFMLANVGYTYDEFMEKTHGNYLELVYEKDRHLLLENAYKEVEGLEYRLVNKTGETMWISETRLHSKSAQDQQLWISSVRVIDEVHRKETELLDALGLEYHTIIYIDRKTERYEFVRKYFSGDILSENGTYEEFLQIARNFLDDYVHPEDVGIWNIYYTLERFFQRKHTQERQFDTYFREKVEKGYQWIQVKMVVGGELSKDTGYVVLAFRNVNEAMLQELERNRLLKSALNRARTANSAKRDFLSKMSHDLRTPLNTILGVTKLAQSRQVENEKAKKYMNVVDSSAKHLLHLVDEILEMNDIEKGTFISKCVDFELEDLIQETAGVVYPDIKAKKQQLKIHTEDIKNGKVTGDLESLEKVCVNLLSNASKYSGENQEIEFSIKELSKLKASCGTYQIKVKDHGIGIPEHRIDEIFEPFERIEDTRTSKQSNVGLGLAITKNIVEILKGDIQVYSKEGCGSEFVVTIPLMVPEVEEIVPETKPYVEGMRVLLAEDNDVNREICYEILTAEGLCVESAVNGKEAVELFCQKAPGYYDGILMDIQMPVMNGYEATKKIRALDEKQGDIIPIIAVTADAFQEDIQLALEAGMNAHVKKPVDYEELLEILAQFRKK